MLATGRDFFTELHADTAYKTTGKKKKSPCLHSFRQVVLMLWLIGTLPKAIVDHDFLIWHRPSI